MRPRRVCADFRTSDLHVTHVEAATLGKCKTGLGMTACNGKAILWYYCNLETKEFWKRPRLPGSSSKLPNARVGALRLRFVSLDPSIHGYRLHYDEVDLEANQVADWRWN